MRNNRTAMVALAFASIASMLLAACAPQVVTQVVEVTKEVEVVQTELVTVQETVVQEVQAEAFTQPHPILSDLRVRQAIAYCSDRDALIQSVYPFVTDTSTLRMDSFIPTDHWAHAPGLEAYNHDPDMAASLLDEAGWTLAEGATVRSNANGDALSLKFTTTSAAFRQTWAAVLEAQLAACGVQIIRLHAPASWWFGDTTGLARRDFELGAFAWVGQADPGGITLYSCDSIPLPSTNWEGQNYMGWCNEAASNGIKNANNTLVKDERIAQYAIVQQEFAKDVPSIPLFNRVDTTATNAALTGYAPAAGEAYSNYNIHEWEIPGADTLILGFSQEPASLFVLVEDAFVARNAANLIFGYGVTSLNYEYKANMYYQDLPTLENGGAVLNNVDVNAGDTVVDANGDVVEVADGVSLRDADGNTVEFAGSAVSMQQMVLTTTLVDGITWSDGEPLKAADMELNSKINCDPDSGATDFTVCERTASEEFSDTSYTLTLIPGYTPPTYFTLVPGWYPSHMVLADGRTLGEVPAAEWTTLPEVAESPLGTGPYVITGWEKGQSMTFEANPNFYLGAPKTPNVTIQFITDTNQAVAQLLTGDVDILFGETTTGNEQTLTDAEAAEGLIKVYLTASATWEHVDINLFTK
jgi:ABC-type transport system substrate-binding protein